MSFVSAKEILDCLKFHERLIGWGFKIKDYQIVDIVMPLYVKNNNFDYIVGQSTNIVTKIQMKELINIPTKDKYMSDNKDTFDEFDEIAPFDIYVGVCAGIICAIGNYEE